MNLIEIRDKVLAGYDINKEEAMYLYSYENYNELIDAANEIRKKYMGDAFDLCTIINAKCGYCSEDCKFCAQSKHYGLNSEVYGFLDEDIILADAKRQKENGILRYSLVVSGKKLSNRDVDKACKVIKRIKEEVGIEVCVSFGLLSYENYKKLNEAGASRVHNNLETSRSFFDKICTTHKYDEKIEALKNAIKAGMEACSGGILGLGETREERLDMAFDLKKLGIKSIPVNVLNPIEGTPLENNEILTREEVNRTIAVYRFIFKDAFIRLAGGRALLGDKGKESFLSGANATITGDMLTTAGINAKVDLDLIDQLGFVPKLVSLNQSIDVL